MKCLGRNLDDHCCYLNGKVCQFLEENIEENFRWSCQLRRELGSWDAVLNDARYKEFVEPEFDIVEKRTGQKINCKDWPSGETVCNQCGANK